MKNKQKLLIAAQAIAEGEKPMVESIETGGRPKTVYHVGGVVLTKPELKKITSNGGDDFSDVQLQTMIMDDEEFQTYCRGALQKILPQLLTLAVGSDDYKFLLNLAKELGDRGYGKATQAIEITNPKRDIRAGWDVIDVN